MLSKGFASGTAVLNPTSKLTVSPEPGCWDRTCPLGWDLPVLPLGVTLGCVTLAAEGPQRALPAPNLNDLTELMRLIQGVAGIGEKPLGHSHVGCDITQRGLKGNGRKKPASVEHDATGRVCLMWAWGKCLALLCAQHGGVRIASWEARFHTWGACTLAPAISDQRQRWIDKPHQPSFCGLRI